MAELKTKYAITVPYLIGKRKKIQDALLNFSKDKFKRAEIRELIALKLYTKSDIYYLNNEFKLYIKELVKVNNTSIYDLILLSNISKLYTEIFYTKENISISIITLNSLIDFLHKILTKKLPLLVRDNEQQEEKIMTTFKKINIELPTRLSLTEAKIHKRVIHYVEGNKHKVKGYMRHGLGYKHKAQEKYTLHDSTIKYFTKVFKLNNIDIIEVFENAGLPTVTINAFKKDRTIRHTISTENFNKFIDYLPKLMIEQESEIITKTSDILLATENIGTVENFVSTEECTQIESTATLTHPQGRKLEVKLTTVREKQLLEEFFISSLEYLEKDLQIETIRKILANK